MAEWHIGDKIGFAEESQRYTVRAIVPGGRYLICTKPFNVRRTVLYTVVDLVEQVRGVDDYGGLGYETPEQIQSAVDMFADGSAELSRRHRPIPLRITFPETSR